MTHSDVILSLQENINSLADNFFAEIFNLPNAYDAQVSCKLLRSYVCVIWVNPSLWTTCILYAVKGLACFDFNNIWATF